MARRKETTHTNKQHLKRAREELKALPPEQREHLRYDGVGPGDSYVGMWRMLNHYRHRLKQIVILLQGNFSCQNDVSDSMGAAKPGSSMTELLISP